MNPINPIMTKFQPAYRQNLTPEMDALFVLFSMIALGCFVVEVVL